MRTKTKQVLSIGGIAFGLFLVASPFLISHAQKKSETQKVGNENQDGQTAQFRKEIAKSVVGSLLFDTISTKEPDWMLNKADYVERGEHNKFTSVGMLLKKGDNFVSFSISEFDSAKDADESFYAPRQYGASVPFNTYGDKGEELIGQRGDLIAIRFRQGNFFVAIFNHDQKTAERFAGYAQEAIKSYTNK